jgi:hypothetical protein
MVVLPLPPPSDLEHLLDALLGRAVKAAPAEQQPSGNVAVALYDTDEPRLEAAVLLDVPLAAALGCALSGIHPRAVQESAASGKIEESLADNVAEVMNVLTRFLVSRSGRRFTLRKVTCPPAAPAADKLAAASGSDEIRSYRIDVEGYGAGQLAICTL